MCGGVQLLGGVRGGEGAEPPDAGLLRGLGGWSGFGQATVLSIGFWPLSGPLFALTGPAVGAVFRLLPGRELVAVYVGCFVVAIMEAKTL